MSSKSLPTIAPAPPPPPTSSQPSEGGMAADTAQSSKVAKRKRLSKACDACHKSKRRCDGTAPCSNCYFADKECLYTNAAGKPVAAPRARPDALPPLASVPPNATSSSSSGPPGRSQAQPRQNGHHPQASSMSTRGAHAAPYTHAGALPHRQHRASHDAPAYGRAGPPPPGHDVVDHRSLPSSHPGVAGYPATAPRTASTMGALELEPALLRELVNLFFAHCHPQRLILHKPTFSAALAAGNITPALLHAVCTLAAVHSKQPRIRTSPPRLAGRPFAEAAVAALFDHQGRLIAPRDLQTAQALVLLEMNDFTSSPAFVSHGRYHSLAISILQENNLSGTDLVRAQIPPEELGRLTIERECMRRSIWLIYTLDLMSYLYLDNIVMRPELDLSIRLPMDETSFELAVLASSAEPEYMDRPAPLTKDVSEFGHWLRITAIFHQSKRVLRELDGQPAAISDIHHAMQVWLASLPHHLQYSEANLELQLSMFETSSNSGAWCFCMMHIVHASCALAMALHDAKRSGAQKGLTKDHWAAVMLTSIVESLGSRARNSVLKGIAVFPLAALYGKKEPYLSEWQADFEKVWELKVVDLALAMEQRLHLPAPPTDSRDAHTSSSLSPPSSGSPSSSTGSDRHHYGASGLVLPSTNEMALPSLPSLKDSGLLHSWDAQQSDYSAQGRMQDGYDAGYPPRRSSHDERAVSYDRRNANARMSNSGGGTGVPVGMPWLADERR